MNLNIADDETIESLFSTTFDSFPMGVLLVDAELRVIMINHSAQSILDRSDELTILEGKLAGSQPAQMDRLRQYVKNASSDSADSFPPEGQALAIPRYNQRVPLEVLVLSPVYKQPAQGKVTPKAIICLFDPVAPNTSAESILRSLYGLTPSEAKLANLLAQGHTINEAAKTLDISVGTARVHLNKLFAKTGTNRQPDLIKHIHVGAAGMVLQRKVIE